MIYELPNYRAEAIVEILSLSSIYKTVVIEGMLNLPLQILPASQ